ncbi:MAG: hypothetical protein [Siphoviridae sp. ctCJE6]|nr:MAG: hypothetical protein [Siphoviridae sp. ctCJE6]
MPVRGHELVARNIIRVGGGFLSTVNQTMESVRDILDSEVTKNISLEDHTLADLRRLGHPYAARHGDKGLPLHDPYWQVHKQSGRLLSSKRSGTVKASVSSGKLEALAFVGLSESVAPHALFVVFGTSKMIPRPVLAGSRLKSLDPAVKLIKKRLKDLKFNLEESK